MSNDEPAEGKCNAELDSGGYCANEAGLGTQHLGGGNCHLHGGNGGAPEGNDNAEGNDGGAPEGNGNAISHGLHADPFNLYDHLEPDEEAWVDALVEKYKERLGYDDDEPNIALLKRACLHVYQANSGEAQILADGSLSQSEVVGINDFGEPVMLDEREEHHLNDTVLSRDKEARQILTKLGAMNPPEQQQADKTGTLAEAIKEVANQ